MLLARLVQTKIREPLLSSTNSFPYHRYFISFIRNSFMYTKWIQLNLIEKRKLESIFESCLVVVDLARLTYPGVDNFLIL